MQHIKNAGMGSTLSFQHVLGTKFSRSKMIIRLSGVKEEKKETKTVANTDL